jgi:hypothetical protein
MKKALQLQGLTCDRDRIRTYDLLLRRLKSKFINYLFTNTYKKNIKKKPFKKVRFC